MLYIALNKYCYIVILLLCTLHCHAWDWWPLPMAEPDETCDSLWYMGGVSAVIAGGSQAPSLFRNNNHGNIAASRYSGNLSIGIQKPATCPNRWFDYDFGVVLTGRMPYTGYFSELYAHTRLYIVDITAGIRPMQVGSQDADLSSGNLIWSANAHPIPRITIGIDCWTAVPGLYGYVEVKGGLTHGWLGDNYTNVTKTLLHHKFIGGRLGGSLPVNISYEFHHVAQWGGYSTTYGDLGNDFRAWMNTFLVRSGGSMANDQINAQGNHIGYQELTLDVKGEDWKVSAYWQHINEDGPIQFMGYECNIADGLWGISMQQHHWPYISGVTYEFLNTTDQSGPFHDKDGCVYGGGDSYYCNSIYTQGWTYYGNIIGNPLLSLTNTRVMAHHVGIKGDIYGYRYRILCTYADNYGTYSKPYRSHNTAVMVEVKKVVPQAWNMEFGIAIGGDFGNQYHSTSGHPFGAMLIITKKGLIKQWKI